MNTKWERIDDDIHNDSARLKVPRGWLVRVTHDYSPCGPGAATGLSIIFVPDEQHEWKL